MRIKTGNQGFLRQQNLSGIINHLYENAPISRIELARQTGLNKATVSSLIAELIHNRFVKEIGEATDRRAGRREMLLDIDPHRGCMASVEIGVGFISVICTDFCANVLWRHREAAENSEPAAALDKTIDLLRRARSAGERKCGPIQGIAISLPGLIDQKTGMLMVAPNLGWRDIDVLETLKESFETRVFIDNEATFAALGEKCFGVARKLNDVLYISAGIGIGGGLIIGGELYNGAAGYASEFGHMTMDPAGVLCGCGNSGCWETLASQAALFRYVRDDLTAGNASSVKAWSAGTPDDLSVMAIVEAAQAGDKVALNALSKTGSYLGIGMDALIKAFNPEMIVFGGRLSLAFEFLSPVIREELKKRSMSDRQRNTPVVAAQFGTDAAVMGGIAKVFQAVLANPGE